MKKSLTTLGMGACVLMALTSCQSTDSDGYSTEEAVPMSEMTVASGEMPPWLLEDSSDFQVDAGPTTHTPHVPIPEPGETMADSGASASGSQKQKTAATDDVQVESGTENVAPIEVAVAPTPAPRPTPEAAPAPKPKPKAEKPVASTKSKAKKPKGKRVTEPKLVTYTVQKGDTLGGIAQLSHTTIANIRKHTPGLKGDTIYPGQVIKVPYVPKGYKAPQKGSKGSSSSSKESKPAKSTTHVVAKGETISGIAKKNGLGYEQVLKANGMTAAEAARIRPGQRIVIPGKASSSSSKSSKKSSKKSTRSSKSKKKSRG